MNAEKFLIIAGFIVLILALVLINLFAFRTIEKKVLEAVDKKCVSSVETLNNINSQQPSATQPAPAPVPPAAQPQGINSERESD